MELSSFFFPALKRKWNSGKKKEAKSQNIFFIFLLFLVVVVVIGGNTLFFSQWTIKQSTDPFDFLAPVSSSPILPSVPLFTED